MKARYLFLSLMTAGLVLAGCQSATMSKEEHKQRTAKTEYNTVVFTDYDLNREFSGGLAGPDNVIRISVENHGITRTDTGTSQVWAVFRNHTDYNYMLEARTSFFAESGMPVDAEPVWQRVSVPANGTATYKEKSVTTDRLKYRVEVRQAK
jgi:uncharacterized protein YceK